ncbi:hypothetical protein WMW72_03110 [Paenibacillus filicis]|uniref:Uncharacterized protein n=1 Tax=Paenibacillus filicis TaxID=669464 RepID=A0ABU9DDG0_9BACL
MRISDFPIEAVSCVLSGIRRDAAIYRRDLQTLGAIGRIHSSAHHERLPNRLDTTSLHKLLVNDAYLTKAAQQMKLPPLFTSIYDEE